MGHNPGTFELKFKVTAAPAVEPVTLVEQKLHMRVDAADEDTLITALIKSARQHLEETSGRAFITQTIDLFLDRFPPADCPIRLPRPALQTVTSVNYKLEGAVGETLFAAANYQVDANAEPGQILLRTGKEWPSDALDPASSVRITYVAGFGLAIAVPEPIRAAVKLFAAHLFENREAVGRPIGGSFQELPMAVKSLMSPWEIPKV